MNIQELYNRYPKIDQIVSLGNENREHSPEIAKICDFVTGLCVDLISYLPAPPAPVVVVQTPRFDPYTGQPLPQPAPAPEPAQWSPPLVGTPGLSQGWPQPAPAPGVVVAPVDEKAEIRALLAKLAEKL